MKRDFFSLNFCLESLLPRKTIQFHVRVVGFRLNGNILDLVFVQRMPVGWRSVHFQVMKKVDGCGGETMVDLD